jgi:hypothetical protein
MTFTVIVSRPGQHHRGYEPADLPGAAPLDIGNESPWPTIPLYGMLDDVRLYDRALSAQEIRDLCSSGKIRFPNRLKTVAPIPRPTVWTARRFPRALDSLNEEILAGEMTTRPLPSRLGRRNVSTRASKPFTDPYRHLPAKENSKCASG